MGELIGWGVILAAIVIIELAAILDLELWHWRERRKGGKGR